MRWSKLGELLSANENRRADSTARPRLGFDLLLEDRTVVNDVFSTLAPVGAGVAALAATALVSTPADDGCAAASTNPAAEIFWVDRREGGCLPVSPTTREVSFNLDFPAPCTTPSRTFLNEEETAPASPTIDSNEGFDDPGAPAGNEHARPLDLANLTGSTASSQDGAGRAATVTSGGSGVIATAGRETGDLRGLAQMVNFANASGMNVNPSPSTVVSSPALAQQPFTYMVQAGDVTARLSPTDAILVSAAAPDNAVAFHFVNANPTAQLTPLDVSPTANASASHDAVYYHDLYPGVDMVYQGNASNPMEYDFMVAPNVDPARITMAIQGAQNLALDPQGNLVMSTSAGTITSSAPVMYQMVNGVQQAVQGGYVVRGDSVGFQVGAYDRTQALVIDPVVTATFTGIPADRLTQWTPGLMAVGGIPNRTTVFTTINASTYGNGSMDASAGIQAAVDACPAGQVVQLSAGNFTVNNAILIHSGITLRGAGAGVTILTKTNGAHGRTNQIVPGTSVFAPVDPGSYSYDAQPVIIIGPSRWPGPDNSTSQNLTADGAQGGTSITVANASGFAAGQIVLLDERSGASWQPTPTGFGSGNPLVWQGDRVAWNMHNPVQQYQDDNSNANANGPYDGTPGVLPAAMGWFSRTDRPTSEVKEIASVSGNTITFTSPLHISYRASHSAQLTRYTPTGSQSGGNSVHVKNAGVESFTVKGGADGQIRFEDAAYCWAKNIENTQWIGEGFAVNNSFRIEIRDSYIHTGSWPEPGGAGYAISFADGSAEVLVENCIITDACKLMVDRSAGAGSVFGYNYTDDSWDFDNPGWVEVGLNASHMAGPHHVLFEGNYSPNADSDYTHGNAIDLTFFRNWLSGQRRDFTDTGNVRTVGLAYGSWYDSFVGNVLGRPGQMSGWVYEDPAMAGNNANWRDEDIWKIGYDPERWGMYADPTTLATLIRDGNYDYLTNSVHWHNTPGGYVIPDSLYLPSKPAFFGSYTWPWVDPTGAAQIFALPAKARFDAGKPNDTTPPGGSTSPAAPTNLTASAGNAQVSLSWNPSSGAASYNVYRWNGSSYALLQNVAGTSFTNTGLTNGTTYRYQVTAVNTAGESAASNQVSATPQVPVTVPAAPTNLTATPGNAQVSLTWTASSGAASYNVYRGATSSSLTFLQSVGSTSLTNTGLTNGTTYYYQVTAVNTAGESGKSNQVSATPVGNPTAVVGFVTTDTSTLGNWTSAYGADGYNVSQDGNIKTPSYAQVAFSNQSNYTWASSTTDTRALQKPENLNDRIAGTWYTNGVPSFTIDVNLTDGASHQVALYALDWDSSSRAETIKVLDAGTGAVLDTRVLGAGTFHNGEYLAWNIKGHVKFEIDYNGGYNAVISGIFFGGQAKANPVVGTGAGLTGQYFADQTLSNLALSRTDATVNFDWGSGSPAANVPVDHFSARWTGQVQAQFSETYTFYTQSDDGVRLWVNGQLLIDNWTDHAPTENSATIALTAGQKYSIKMEYYENGGGAVAKLLWSSASTAKQAVPTSQLYSPAGTETTWVEDAIPAGATPAADGGDAWTWIGSNPTPFAGGLASQSNIAAGEHQHYFYGAANTLAVATGDKLFAYVNLDPANPPSEVMLQWNAGGSWEHRAYWGANNIGWGVDGTVSRRFMGALPATGGWVRLEVPASLVGLEGATVNGMAFTLFGGRATWDHAGKVAAAATPATAPSITTQPASLTITAGQSASFSVTASGTAPFTYQWQKQINGTWTNISGATAATFSIAGTAAADAGSYRALVTNSAGQATSNPAMLTVNAAATPITMGETNVAPLDDSGNANLLLAQKTTLAQAGTLQSLSFYVTQAAGSLRLGVYDATGPNGGPGKLLAQTNAFTPVVGWNTANVITPVHLAPGTYWLAYLPSDNNLQFRVDRSSGTLEWFAYTFGPMASTFSTTPTVEAAHWSLYATLTPG